MDTLSGKTALCLASSQGIGFAVAMELYQNGVDLVLNSRDSGKLNDAKRRLLGGSAQEGNRISLAPFDVQNPDQSSAQIVEILESLPKGIQILICNTGGFIEPICEKGTAEFERELLIWEKAINDKFKCLVRIIELVIVKMKVQRFGQIVNIGSVYSKEPGFGYGYSETVRLMITAYLKKLSTRVAKDGIRVNQVLCGCVDTEGLRSYFEKKKKGSGTNDLRIQIIEQIPMARFANAKEIANVVRFLVSSDASYITGQSIVVDGGLIRTAL